jgi:hypothetical protein
MRGRTDHRSLATLAIAAALVLAACGGDGGSGTTGPTDGSGPTGTPTASGPRPASTAELTIISPTDGQVIEGGTVALEVDLQGAEIVPATTTDIVPDEGHLHVILDDQLISMTGDLEQTIPDVAPGQHLLKVEFVASDHVPFDPRVIAAVSFETTG